MNHLRLLFIASLIALTALSCNQNKPFITDAEYLKVVEHDLTVKTQELGNPEVLTGIKGLAGLSLREQQALQFLYTYMPLGDLVDYSTEFYLQNIHQSFRTQQEMPWGKDVPEMLFRHFVLPVRVNNENMDSSRVVFYRELKERVKGLTMHEAILEVNHWCHQKANYQSSDARTSSPLATVCTAYGRCGEESTLTVAALRAVGIPARQVYTPRWAHTDDNHAWVEAWADGEWHYIGACEPAPELNMGWFDAPAKRVMLLHTKVFGRYNGPEDLMQQTRSYAEINITSNYAPTSKVEVEVVDKNGNPVEGAEVEFGIYNYSEFFPVFSAKTSAQGRAFITAGIGSLSVWVVKDGAMGFDVISVGSNTVHRIMLNFDNNSRFTKNFTVVPPVEAKVERNIPQAIIDATEFRKAQNDSMRNAYIDTFISKEHAKKVAEELNADKHQVVMFLEASRGNWQEISTFLSQAGKEKVTLALKMLEQLSAKDLRDTPASVLLDHLNNVNPQDNEVFYKYVLNPRVQYELLTSYRSWFQNHLPNEVIKLAKKNPASLVNWVSKIKVADDYNPQQICMSPIGVMELGVADSRSRDVFFVAVCRSLGIPARLEEVTGQLQYFHEGIWQVVDFEQSAEKTPATSGYIHFKYTPTLTLANPHYDTHFTIARVVDGQLQRLNFRDTEGNEGTVTWKSNFTKPIALDEGAYWLITGNRLENGSVLSHVEMFQVIKGKTTCVNLEIRSQNKQFEVIGAFNPKTLYQPVTKAEKISLGTSAGDDYFVLAILGAGQEPSNHAVRDFINNKVNFEEWNRPLIFLFKDKSQWDRFQRDSFKGLPSNTTYGTIEDSAILEELVKALKLSSATDLPIVVIANKQGQIVFVSQGYRIGLGDQLLQAIKAL